MVIRESLLKDPQMATLVQRSFPFVTSLQGRLPSREELVEWTEATSAELATTILYQAILHSPLHSSFMQSLRSYRDHTPAEQHSPNGWEILFVPSELQLPGLQWGAVTSPLRVMARQWGYGTDEVATQKSASISENARIIGSEIMASPADNIILLSHGRGSAEVRRLLQLRSDRPYLQKVRAWINISGSVQGSAWCRLQTTQSTPLLPRLKQWWQSYWQQEYRWLKLELSPDQPFWQAPFVPPSDLFVVNLTGFNTRQCLPTTFHASFEKLKSEGPNDGVNHTLSSIVSEGVVFPIWGLSHLAEPERLHPVMSRLWQALPSLLKNSRRENPSARYTSQPAEHKGLQT